MKAIEFRNMTADELNVRMGELKGELFNLRFQNATNQLDNPMKIVEVRRNIARVKTVQRELELRKNA
ncbi:MAG: 50S ribosomal protein L29 [Clostridiales bacterium]|nr:50S ribosomal protein L29 [Clostridiales bacterium]